MEMVHYVEYWATARYQDSGVRIFLAVRDGELRASEHPLDCTLYESREACERAFRRFGRQMEKAFEPGSFAILSMPRSKVADSSVS